MSIILKVYKYICELLRKARPESKKTPTRRPRAKPVKSMWPQIKEGVENWEKCFNDTRVDRAACNLPNNMNAYAVLKYIKEMIPPFGAYCSAEDSEIYRRHRIDVSINQSAFTPKHICHAHIAKNMDGDMDDNIFNHGISLVIASATDQLWDGVYAFNGGILYNLYLTHWSESKGHMVLGAQIIIDKNKIYPTWQHNTVYSTVGSGRNQKTICNQKWDISGGKWFHRLAVWINFYLQRDGNWNCVVKSKNVPPLAFPIVENDIARVFPARQRDGKGRIVHFTRTHKRKTKNGYTNVRTHIKGNTEWNIDGRSVSIIMPGKHCSYMSESMPITSDMSGESVKDSTTGLNYYVVKENMYKRLLRKARVKVDQIEIAA